VKYAFIEQHRDQYPVRKQCRVLRVSPSGFYDWQQRGPSLRTQQNQQLVVHLKRVHAQSRENYGVLKAWKVLQAEGIACGRNRVASLRAAHNIYARRRRRFVVTTRSRQTPGIAPNYLNRQFQVAHPNQVWVGDVTFIATRKGWLFLAVLLDLYSRKVIGWSMSQKNNRELVRDCLLMAVQRRNPAAGLMHHTDQGVTYSADESRRMLDRFGMIASMSRKGDCWDNAVAESFFGQLKNELICGYVFHTIEEARSAIFDYIEVFYNRQRLHQTLGYVTPEQFEMKAVA
jgi:putative transposase